MQVQITNASKNFGGANAKGLARSLVINRPTKVDSAMAMATGQLAAA